MNPMTAYQAVLAGLLAATLSLAAPAQATLPLAELGAGMYRIEAEVAHTPPARQLGLMNRVAMPAQRGMVFVFPAVAVHCKWMKNTLLPLAVAFLDEQGRILNIAEMKPQSEDNHCAAAPARYALEMNAGWFASRGVKAGDVIRGVERLPAPH